MKKLKSVGLITQPYFTPIFPLNISVIPPGNLIAASDLSYIVQIISAKGPPIPFLSNL